MQRIFVFLLIAVGLLAGCQPAALDTSSAIKFELSSPAFEEGGSIPQKFTCQGENASPELSWSAAPANTQSFALIVDDPDAPGGTFTHWVLFDIPADTQQLAGGAGLIGLGGNNGLNQPGYMGPCPPSGIHRYDFRLYALDIPSLSLNEGAARSEVEAAMKNHVIGIADTMGRYGQQ